MKKGKGDEKVLGPMFPRLHVNDTEKGGPRAPPRNKMALYEQLSIPSQRFNSGVSTYNSNNDNSVPPSSQWNGHENYTFFPQQLTHKGYSDLNTSSQQLGAKKKSDEDDFRVPVFSNSGMPKDVGNCYNPAYSGHFNKFHNISDRDAKRIGSAGPKIQCEDLPTEPVTNREPVKVTSVHLSTNKSVTPLEQSDAIVLQEQRKACADNFGRSHKSDHCLQRKLRSDLDADGRIHNGTTRNDLIGGTDNEDSSVQVRDYPLDQQKVRNDLTTETGPFNDKTHSSLQTVNAGRGDDVSETSMVDSVSHVDISPDDIVGIIGQKLFWKARKAISNQQRMFAVQVFELHRLIKVQRLIAASPHLLIEDGSDLGKTLKVPPAKTFPLEYIVKASQNAPKQYEHDAEKQSQKMECSAENTVPKASLSNAQNGSQPSIYKPISSNPPSASMTNEHNMNPWCFPQPPGGQQWLIPVMSPSEGLVYKPYPGPGLPGGLPGPAFGGCEPSPGLTPFVGNLMPPAFSVPAVHPPFASSPCHGYFPLYGMPLMSRAISASSVEMSNFASPGWQTGESANMHRPNLSNLQTSKQVGTPEARMPPPKDAEIQASTGSSPSVIAKQGGADSTPKGMDVLSLFPTSPVITAAGDGNVWHHEATRVIKVVPHNGMSATESAARIFQSIQEERKQSDAGFGY